MEAKWPKEDGFTLPVQAFAAMAQAAQKASVLEQRDSPGRPPSVGVACDGYRLALEVGGLYTYVDLPAGGPTRAPVAVTAAALALALGAHEAVGKLLGGCATSLTLAGPGEPVVLSTGQFREALYPWVLLEESTPALPGHLPPGGVG